MESTEVISQRLKTLIERLLGQQINVSGDPKLGGPPLGFDPHGLRELRGRINNGGFADVLKEQVTPAEVTGSTRFSSLVDAIVRKT